MNLLLIRHADASPAGKGDPNDDESRTLSEAGVAQCKPLARSLERLGMRPTLVISSPLLRARQTASGLLHNWEGTPPELRIAEPLAPGGKKAKLEKLLLGLTAETVALVGHMPDLGQFTAWLIGSKKARIEIAKAGAALLVTDAFPSKGGAALTWMLRPDICNLIGG